MAKKFVLVIVGCLLLAPLPAAARLVGSEFSFLRFDFHEAWAGGAAYESSNGKFLAAWHERSTLGAYPFEPWIGWLSLGGTTATTYKLATTTTDSSVPDVFCRAYAYHCLATWVVSGQVYARWVASDGNMGSTWRVDTDGGGVESTVVYGYNYLIVWQMDDGRIAMRHVDVTNGPTGSVAYIQRPASCTTATHPRVAYSTQTQEYGIAFECVSMVHLEARDEFLNYQWSRNPTMPSTLEYAPDVAADKFGNFLLVFETANPLWGIYAQRYDGSGNAVGSPFVITASSTAADPALATSWASDAFLMVYADAGNIYAARIGMDGTVMPLRYTITTASGDQLAPQISTREIGGEARDHLIIWNDLRAGAQEGDLYGRWFEMEPRLEAGQPYISATAPSSVDYFQSPAPPGQWLAVGLRPGASSDVDLYLSDSPNFDTSLTSSTRGTGRVDLVVMNRNIAGQMAYFPSVEHYSGSEGYTIEYTPRADQLYQDDSTQQSLADDSVARMYEVYALAGQQLVVHATPTGADVGLALFDPNNGTHQSLSQAVMQVDDFGPGQVETLYFTPSQTGWMGLLLWKNNAVAGSVTLSTGDAPPSADHVIYLPFAARNW